MIGVNPKGEVWVFAEQHDGKLEDTGLELMSKARYLADTLKVKVGGGAVGQQRQGIGADADSLRRR